MIKDQLTLFGDPEKTNSSNAYVVLEEHIQNIDLNSRKKYVSYGAGRNSTAMIIGLWSLGIRPDAILFADTGGEKPETYAFIVSMNKWLKAHDFPFVTVVSRQSMNMVKHGRYTTLEEQCIANKTMPSKVFGGSTCSVSWKVEPMERWIKQKWGEDIKSGLKPICFKGIHAGETKRFFGKSGKPFLEDDVSIGFFPLINPLRWHQGHCESAILGAGLPMPPKSSCFYCPNSKKKEVVELEETHPKLYERAIAIERGGMENVHNANIKGLGREWSWAEINDPAPLFQHQKNGLECYCIDD